MEERTEIYHCPKCAGDLVRRDDDTPEELKRAYDLYCREGEAIIGILTADVATNVFRIDGTPSPSFIAAGLISNINSFK